MIDEKEVLKQVSKPVKVAATFGGFRINGDGEVWFHFEVPMLEVPNLMITNLWDRRVQLYAFAQLEGQKPLEVGPFMWNGSVQTPDNTRKITLRSKMDVVAQVEPRFDFTSLTHGQPFTILLALPEQVRRQAIEIAEKRGGKAKKVKDEKDA